MTVNVVPVTTVTDLGIFIKSHKKKVYINLCCGLHHDTFNKQVVTRNHNHRNTHPLSRRQKKKKFKKIKPSCRFSRPRYTSHPTITNRFNPSYNWYGCRHTESGGTITHHGKFVGVPKSSPLIKFAILPRANANSTGTARMSAILKNEIFFFLQ